MLHRYHLWSCAFGLGVRFKGDSIPVSTTFHICVPSPFYTVSRTAVNLTRIRHFLPNILLSSPAIGLALYLFKSACFPFQASFDELIIIFFTRLNIIIHFCKTRLFSFSSTPTKNQEWLHADSLSFQGYSCFSSLLGKGSMESGIDVAGGKELASTQKSTFVVISVRLKIVVQGLKVFDAAFLPVVFLPSIVAGVGEFVKIFSIVILGILRGTCVPGQPNSSAASRSMVRKVFLAMWKPLCRTNSPNTSQYQIYSIY